MSDHKEHLLERAPLFILAVMFVVLGSAFTVFPELLDHTAFSFETRGPVHHLWHYIILMGGLVLALGIWYKNESAEVIGLWSVIVAILINTVAALEEHGATSEIVTGLDLALRVSVMLALAVRIYVIVR